MVMSNDITAAGSLGPMGTFLSGPTDFFSGLGRFLVS